MAAMLSAIEIMRAHISEQAGTRARDVVERQITHLRRIVDDLLDIARVAQGKLDLQKERTDCRDVIQDALSSASALCREHHHNLSVSLPEQPIWLEGDRTRLLQVFANLLTNAAKYTDNGGHIFLKAQSDGTTVTIWIKDNGRGIAAGALPHIFELFMQEEQADYHGGLGIGLRVVRELVELHGGSVTARSEGIGRGSEFIVTLPISAPVST